MTDMNVDHRDAQTKRQFAHERMAECDAVRVG